VRFGAEFGCLSQSYQITTTTTTSPCPCWYDGFMFWVELEPESGLFVGLNFENTNQLSNGLPIFSTLFIEEFVNIFWNGTNWIFLSDEIISDGNVSGLTINFDGNEPIGNFTIDGELTGFAECSILYKPIIVYLCGEFIFLNCNIEYYIPYFSGTSEIGYFLVDGPNSTIDYVGDEWVLTLEGNEVATLTGLTITDEPVGIWDITDPTYTAVTSTTVLSLFEPNCECLRLESTG
jgi:hypothetical protein